MIHGQLNYRLLSLREQNNINQKRLPFFLGMGPSTTLILKVFATDPKLIFNCTREIFTLVGILHCFFSPMFIPSLMYLTEPVLSLNLTSYFTEQSPDSTFFHFTLTQPAEGFPACGVGRASRFAVMNYYVLL